MGLQQTLLRLRPQLVAAAQECYDAWDQSDPEYGDPMLGFGGLCGEMAKALSSVLSDAGIDVFPLSLDEHEALIASDGCELYGVDIPYWYYETGGGYCWQKISDVQFQLEHLEVWKLDESWKAYVQQGDFD
jgi:hypothetical protein